MEFRAFMLGLSGLFLGAMTAYNSDIAASYFFSWVPETAVGGPIELAVLVGAVTGFFTGAANA